MTCVDRMQPVRTSADKVVFCSCFCLRRVNLERVVPAFPRSPEDGVDSALNTTKNGFIIPHVARCLSGAFVLSLSLLTPPSWASPSVTCFTSLSSSTQR